MVESDIQKDNLIDKIKKNMESVDIIFMPMMKIKVRCMKVNL